MSRPNNGKLGPMDQFDVKNAAPVQAELSDDKFAQNVAISSTDLEKRASSLELRKQIDSDVQSVCKQWEIKDSELPTRSWGRPDKPAAFVFFLVKCQLQVSMFFGVGGNASDLPTARPKMPEKFNCNTHYVDIKVSISESSFTWFLSCIGIRDPRNYDAPPADTVPQSQPEPAEPIDQAAVPVPGICRT